MSTDTSKKLTAITKIGTIEEQCISNNSVELAKFITENFVAASSDFENQVIVSRDTPSTDQRSGLWVRLDSNNAFMGFYMFNGTAREWQLVVNALPNAAVPRQRIYYKFESGLNQSDMPEGYKLDDDPLLAKDQKTADDGGIRYAWIVSEKSDL